MISKVSIKRFKKLDIEELILPDHIVLAGPNNTGKTTVLQALAAWALTLNRWLAQNEFHRRGGQYQRAPIARQDFYAVPLRDYDLLFKDRVRDRGAEIRVVGKAGWDVTMEIWSNTSEQVFVRPRTTCLPEHLRAANTDFTFVPPMTGLSTEEPVYQAPMLTRLLGQGKPGEVLRNVLVEAERNEKAWDALTKSIEKLFNYKLLVPDARGASINAEYQTSPEEDAPRFDIASAGSGFQQVLMLLALLHTRPGSVLLLDEPDAHLHVLLQDAIYAELREVAAASGSQLIIATHSEVVLNTVEPKEVCVLLNQPKFLGSTTDRDTLLKALGALDNVDLMLAEMSPGVLYVEDYTDLDVLRAFAKVLEHSAYECLLAKTVYWRKTVVQPVPGCDGIKARDHYKCIQMVKPDLPGLQLVDGDGVHEMQSSPITGAGLQTLRWERYEIESYLVHPDALARYVSGVHGTGIDGKEAADLKKYLADNLPPAVLADPLGDHAFLKSTKARTLILPQALRAGGVDNLDYTHYHVIASQMVPEEIPAEVTEKLDSIMRAFNMEP
jgi:predicted ATPase